jgi:hypothetical protein
MVSTVQEDQFRRVEVGLTREPGLAAGNYIRPLLFAGVRRPFLNVTPWRR